MEHGREFMLWCIVLMMLIDRYLANDCSSQHRKSSLTVVEEQTLVSYNPRTDVFDNAAIDLDVMCISDHLNTHTEKSFEDAFYLYQNGAYSASYANITLNSPLATNASKGSNVKGISIGGQLVYGTIMEDVREGDEVVFVQYNTTIFGKSKHVECVVGGSPMPLFDGCLQASGFIAFGGVEVGYTYVPETDNRNNRTVEKFSVELESEMGSCDDDDCFSHELEKFYSYYGKMNYADEWIRSAFLRDETGFLNGNINFSNLTHPALAETIHGGMLYMSFWMYVILKMEEALQICNRECNAATGECSCDSIHAWDQAVAYYTGSEQEVKGQGGLLYTMVNIQCTNFSNCGVYGEENKGVAYVNIKVLDLFNQGQKKLLRGKCDDARRDKDEIVQLMIVPLVQGTLDTAYSIQSWEQQKGISNEVLTAQGAIFAASLLPLVHFCSHGDADIISRNMVEIVTTSTDTNSSALSFEDVRDALERNYDCLGITCADVGDLTRNSTVHSSILCNEGLLAAGSQTQATPETTQTQATPETTQQPSPQRTQQPSSDDGDDNENDVENGHRENNDSTTITASNSTRNTTSPKNSTNSAIEATLPSYPPRPRPPGYYRGCCRTSNAMSRNISSSWSAITMMIITTVTSLWLW